MLKRVLTGIFTVIGLAIGYLVAYILLSVPKITEINYIQTTTGSLLFYIIVSLIFGIIMFLLSPKIYKSVKRLIAYIEKIVQKMSVAEILYGTFGAIVALILATFIAGPIGKITFIGPVLYIIINIISAMAGAAVMIKKKDDITAFLVYLKKSPGREKKLKDKEALKETSKSHQSGIPKVLDTSVIIDGRIFDICETGFVEGPLVIPNFVLDELRHISDSADSLKRNRGRRGLDILNKIQKELKIETRIVDDDFKDIAEVDAKLLKLAQKMDGKVVTNDYNLNKVAEFQGVPVLNINELSNAIKQVVLPGEEMNITVIKDGKESSQGVGYLDDGTMIVIEEGRKLIGKTITVIVTSVLQTAAGRMIFAKPKES